MKLISLFQKRFDLAVDAGCGQGQLSASFADKFEQIIGVDISSARIHQAEKNNAHDNIHYRCDLLSQYQWRIIRASIVCSDILLA